MGEVLSQSEIDDLLKALSSGELDVDEMKDEDKKQVKNMIKQDFYIANLIARYLSEEITPEETIKLTNLERRIYSARDFIQENL